MADVAGRILDRAGAMYNVRHPDFAADATGAADATVAIQAALNAAAADGGGSVVIPPGTYRIGYWQSTAVVPLSVPSHVHLWVQPGATLNANPAISVAGGYPNGWADRGVIETTSTDGVRITLDGVIDGLKEANPDGRVYGIYARGATRLRISGSGIIRNMPANPGYAANPAGNGGDGVVIYGHENSESVDVEVTGITVEGVDRSAFSILGGCRVRLIGITALNTTGNNPGTGVDIEPDPAYSAEDIQIVAAHLEGNRLGISCSPRSRRVSIVSPTCRNNRKSDIVLRGTELEVIGGMIHNAKDHAITIYQTSRVSVHGTRIEGTQADATPDVDERAAVLIFDSSDVDVHVHASHTCQSAVYVDQAGVLASTVGSRNLRISGTFVNCVDETQRNSVGVVTLASNGSTKQVFDVDLTGVRIRDSRPSVQVNNGPVVALRGVYVTGLSQAEKNTIRYPIHVQGPTNAVGGDTGAVGGVVGRRVSVAWPEIPAGAVGEVDVTVPGAETFDGVSAVPRATLGPFSVHGPRVTAADTVRLRVRNDGAAAATPVTVNWTFALVKMSS